MGYEFINKLPTPAEIKEQFPLPVECAAAKAQRDEEVKKQSADRATNFLSLSVPALLTTKIPFWIIPAVW